MSDRTSLPKTLRQYRKEQETTRAKTQGSDFEDWMILQCAQQTPPEQALWRAVILQMITDAISNSAKPDQKRFRRDARHWLTRHSRDFRLVCEYAGYDPTWLQEQIDRFLAQHESPPAPIKMPKHTNHEDFGFSVRYSFQNATPISLHSLSGSYDNA